MTEDFVDETTGEIFSAKDWIMWRDPTKGILRKVKRLSDKQLAFIESLEYQLGHAPKNHRNMPAFKASGYINKLKEKLDKKNNQESLF